MAKKIISAIVAGCLVGGLMFNPAAFAEERSAVIATKPSSVDGDLAKAKFPLDQAIAKAKDTFTISNDYERFESGFNTYGERAEWHLNWTRSAEPRGNISVRVNAATGEIFGMDRWEELPPGQKYSGLPRYSYDESAKFAKEWIQKLLPAYAGQIKLVSNQDQPFYGFGDRGPVEYYYNFNRVANGIVFPGNNIYIRISGDTGELLGFGLNWDEKTSFPSAAGRISPTEAEKVIGQNIELVYYRPWTNGAKDTPVKLVYRVKKGANLMVDAFTGKVVEGQLYEGYDRAMGGEAKKESASRNEMTPAEQAEVDKIKNLLSAEKAMDKVKNIVSVPAELKLMESRLNQDYQYPEQKQWTFHWNNEKNTTDVQSISAAVNAVTGELVYYNIWKKGFDERKTAAPAVSVEQARQKAEDFIKKQQPKRLAEIKLDNSLNSDYLEKGITRNYHFSYLRVVNGIPFTNNGFEIEVDGNTGEITNYQMNWWDVKFPDKSQEIGHAKASSIFLSGGGLGLEYINTDRGANQPKVNLVYRLKDRPSYLLDAKSGQYLNTRGDVIAPKETTDFTDISGHPGAEAIKQLAKANIVKAADGKFYPDRNITKIEALEMLVASRGWYVSGPYDLLKEGKDKEEEKKRLLNAAVSLGIIQPDDTKDLAKELTRLELAKLMINTLDYDGVAKLAQIYTLPTRDAQLVPDQLRGYAALSLGLGLQTDNQGNYVPNENVSRGHAAISLVRMLKVQK
ncbi:YcdB/YcdC domain-containing protein [Desulfotomaculum sp. 1211_IL3151]|uniref:YcdB/YcdC domain-containing protein n=1 Tax=Desulfotomaculum sp. 1211_IL3151 TaxID=3084055 RepID=UPI002FDA7AF9